MSKKSRRRNKKILAALALAGGAALMAKRGQGVAQGVSGADKAAFTSDAAYKLPSKAAVAADIAQDVVKPDTSGFQTRFTKKIGNKWMGPNEIRLGNINPHEATAAAGAAYRPHRVPPGSMRRFKGGGIAKRGTGAAYKKGGRVTGIAKRGFGRALMKGKK